MAAQPGRTDRAIDRDTSFHPLTWVVDEKLVRQIWDEPLAQYWAETMCDLLPREWQRELARRSRLDFTDLLDNVVGGLSETADPSLVLRNLHREFARFGVTLDYAPHPTLGDVLENARFIESGRSSDAVSGPIAIDFDEESVVRMWTDLADFGVAPGGVHDLLWENGFGDWEFALDQRYAGAVGEVIEQAVADLAESADPSLVFLRLRDTFAADGIPLTFAPHPEHGDLIARARQIDAADN